MKKEVKTTYATNDAGVIKSPRHPASEAPKSTVIKSGGDLRANRTGAGKKKGK